MPSPPGATASRDATVEDVAAVPRVRAHLAGPTPLVHRLRPGVARQHLGALDLVERVVEGFLLDHDRLALAAEHHRQLLPLEARDRKSTRLNSSHLVISYAVFCLKKKKYIISRCAFC